MATSTHGSRLSTFKYNETTTAPGVNDDTTEGYVIGSIWLDTTNDRAYIALDVTDGAAVWKLMTTPVEYSAPGADTTLTDTDQNIVSRDVANLVAGDKVVIEGAFTILNNSGAVRAYTITMDFDGLFDAEITTDNLSASATDAHPMWIRAILDIRATNLCYMVCELQGERNTGQASGADVTTSSTTVRAMTWGTSTTDATGTTTVTVKARSNNNAAGQTLRLHGLEIRKVK